MTESKKEDSAEQESKGYFSRNVLIIIVSGILLAAVGSSARAIMDVNVLQAQRLEDVKHIESNGDKIDKLQEAMNDNFKTVIQLLNNN